ncbi:MAG: Sporulation initiation phosphotransferase F [Nitrospira sp.]|nr:Sporulation initiation phosphotransferase F [Nitrospira sp.]
MNHILVVDDDPSILLTVSVLLRDEGYTVRTATNGAEALTEVTREIPSLVLLDMRMPVMDGWGFKQAVDQLGLDFPIMVMTAARDAAAWAKQIGAGFHLAKPFDIDVLVDEVKRARRESHDGLTSNE